LTWDAEKKNGIMDIYEAREGNTNSFFDRLKDQNTKDLMVYIGFSLFGKTTSWTRTALKKKNKL